MPFLGSKYAKIAFVVGAEHAGGAYSAPPGSLAGLRGPTSTGRGEESWAHVSKIPGSAPVVCAICVSAVSGKNGTNNILGITLTNTNI